VFVRFPDLEGWYALAGREGKVGRWQMAGEKNPADGEALAESLVWEAFAGGDR
jgi:hypothetical protein